jgi:hypothetical protein
MVMVLQLSAQPSPKQNAEAAKRVWEEVIKAKGGRERLYAIRTLGIRYEGTERRWLRNITWNGRRAIEFPYRVWRRGQDAPFQADRPGLSSHLVMDAETRVGWVYGSPEHIKPSIVSAVVKNNICDAAENYLLETKWYQPKIVGLSETKWFGRNVLVIYAETCSGSSAYLIDPETKLPVGLVYLWGMKLESSPPIPNQTGPMIGRGFENYESVDGVQLPRKTTLGNMTFEMNRQYPKSLFTTPPVPSDWGPWPPPKSK